MTSTVKISAHCSKEKHVLVTITGVIDFSTGDTGVIEEFVLEDGESADRAIYDSRKISAIEVLKGQPKE